MNVRGGGSGAMSGGDGVVDTAKLWVHDSNFSQQPLLISLEALKSVQEGDLIKIYHVDVGDSDLLLKVDHLSIDAKKQLKGGKLSIDKNLAELHDLVSRKDVVIERVQPESVALELVELAFKDQYISRSDMWRLRMLIVGTAAHVSKKITFAGIRATVNEMVMDGRRVQSGYITDATRIVFRSRSAQFQIFLQMSSEMWDYDEDGDLYFEKAVSGLLTEWFERWSKMGCNHEVSVVMFSRTYYDDLPSSLEDAPGVMALHPHLVWDACYGCWYEDFYKVVVQHEYRSDWRSLLLDLKREFMAFPHFTHCEQSTHALAVQEAVEKETAKLLSGRQSFRTEANVSDFATETEKMPTAMLGRNSTAARGNYLNAVNMSLNAFDKHYYDRNFERTGQMVVIITAGTGVFHVDHDLTLITKQRMIDNGIGSDLVCLARPPLHTVPLFIFSPRPTTIPEVSYSNYSIPHWVHVCFYQSRTKGEDFLRPFRPACFVPRCRMPEFQYSVMKGAARRDSIGGTANNHGRTTVVRSAGDHQYHTSSDVSSKHGNGEITNFADILESKFTVYPTSIPLSYHNGLIDPEYYDECIFRDENSSVDHLEGQYSLRFSNRGINDALALPASSYVGSNTGTKSSPRQHSKDLVRNDARESTSSTIVGDEGGDLGGGNDGRLRTCSNRSSSSGSFFDVGPGRVRSSSSDHTSADGQQQSSNMLEDNDDIQYIDEDDSDTAGTLTANVTPIVSLRASAILKSISPSENVSDISPDFRSREANNKVGRLIPEFRNRRYNAETAKTTANSTTLLMAESYGGSSWKSGPPSDQSPSSNRDSFVSDATALAQVGRGEEDFDFYDEIGEHQVDDALLGGNTNSTPIPIIYNEQEHTGRSRRMHIKSNRKVEGSVALARSFDGMYQHGTAGVIRVGGTAANLKSLYSPSRDNPIEGGIRRCGRTISSTSSRHGSAKNFRFVNPFHPQFSAPRLSSNRRRWAHIFPSSMSSSHEPHSPNWKSMCQPACLPLTTDYYPNADELNSKYDEYTYILALDDDDDASGNVYGSNTQALLQELISQRLAQGYQLVTTSLEQSESTSSTGRVKSGVGPGRSEIHSAVTIPQTSTLCPSSSEESSMISQVLRVPSTMSSRSKDGRSIGKSGTTIYYLSMGHNFHRISYDSRMRNIEVKLFLSRHHVSLPTYTYKYNLCSKYDSSYHTVDVVFRPSDQIRQYNWNYMDQLVYGDFRDLVESLKFWRARYVLLPIRSLTGGLNESIASWLSQKEDIDILGKFMKTIDAFNRMLRSMSQDAEMAVNVSVLGDLQVEMIGVTGSKNIACQGNERSRQSSGGPPLTMLSPPSFIGILMNDTSIGPTLSSCLVNDHVVAGCIWGCHIVDWLLMYVSDVDSRESAIIVASKLLEYGIINRLEGVGFYDGYIVYCLRQIDSTMQTMESTCPSPSLASISNPASSNNAASTNSMSSIPSSESRPNPTITDSVGTMNEVRRLRANGVGPNSDNALSDPIAASASPILTKGFRLDVDPTKKSDRREWIDFYHDGYFSPHRTFHIELHWLVATGCLVDEFVQLLARKSLSCGFVMIPAPIEQIKQLESNTNPFRSAIFIPLAATFSRSTVVPESPLSSSATMDISLLSKDKENDEGISSSWLTSKRLPSFQELLLSACGFVLDIEADSCVVSRMGSSGFSQCRKPNYTFAQFIHISGCALVQIIDSKDGFLWCKNQCASVCWRFSRPPVAAIEGDYSRLFSEFKTLCGDRDRLAEIWHAALAEERKRVPSYSSDSHVPINITSSVPLNSQNDATSTTNSLDDSGQYRDIRELAATIKARTSIVSDSSISGEKCIMSPNSSIDSKGEHIPIESTCISRVVSYIEPSIDAKQECMGRFTIASESKD